jgi:hypothetical protein
MNHYFGWVHGSNMPGVYIHLSGRDIDDAVLKANVFTGNDNTADTKTDDSDVNEEIDNLVKKRVKEALENITWK